jgi:hypothetical protein
MISNNIFKDKIMMQLAGLQGFSANKQNKYSCQKNLSPTNNGSW